MEHEGFVLQDALLALFVVSLLCGLVQMLAQSERQMEKQEISHEIDTQWFYPD